MIKLKLDSFKGLNAQNTFVSAWLLGFAQHNSPRVLATGGKDDRKGEGKKLYKTASHFIQAGAQRETRTVIKQARGAEGE